MNDCFKKKKGKRDGKPLNYKWGGRGGSGIITPSLPQLHFLVNLIVLFNRKKGLLKEIGSQKRSVKKINLPT